MTLDDSTFDEHIKGSEKPILVDFWAEWCGPCRVIAPIMEEFATEDTGFDVAKLNVDDAPSIALRYEVMSIPTLILFKDGHAAQRIVGAKGKSQLLQEIQQGL